MADVSVFVDDAVLGRLPDICAVDGVPATNRLRIVEEIGRSSRVGVLWLLVLTGPLGWIALLFLATRDSGERLAVEVPYSTAAYDRLVRARHLRNCALAVGAAATIGLLWLSAWASLHEAGVLLTLGAALATVVTTLTGEWRISMTSVGVNLDASRRWVTLRRVHPTFAAACMDQRARQHQA